MKEVREKTPVQVQRSDDAERLSPLAALLRRHDRDRYQTALFAPAARRDALFALYAFNYEIARVRQTVSQPILGHIRLEWWRENIAAAFAGEPPRRHPVVDALGAAIRQCRLTRAHFDRLIDARAADLADEAPATLSALEEYAEDSSSPLIYLALEALEAREPAAAAAGCDVGVAYALAGLLRALPWLPPTGRPLIPSDVAARAGLRDPRGARPSPALCAAVRQIAAVVQSRLQAARAQRPLVPRTALPALLPAMIAARSLHRLNHAGYDPFDRRLARADPLQSWRLAAAVLRRRF